MKAELFSHCKAILFDFGGTLDSDGEHWLDRFYELYELAGVDRPRDEIKRVFYQTDELCCNDPAVNHLGLRPLMQHHVRLQFGALKLEDPLREARLVDEFCSKTERYLERNGRLIRRLSRRYRLGVVSNFYGNVAALCREAGLAEFMDVILDSTQIGMGKPSPEVFRMALDGVESAAGETIFVGDSYERDMMPARALGMRTIWVKGPHPRLPANPQPVDDIILSLAELESLAL